MPCKAANSQPRAVAENSPQRHFFVCLLFVVRKLPGFQVGIWTFSQGEPPGVYEDQSGRRCNCLADGLCLKQRRSSHRVVDAGISLPNPRAQAILPSSITEMLSPGTWLSAICSA